MGILQNSLGINLTNHMPLVHSVFNNDFDNGEPFPPGGSEDLITEGGVFILTEGLDFLTTE